MSRNYFEMLDELVADKLEKTGGKYYLDLRSYEIVQSYCEVFDEIAEYLGAYVKEIELEDSTHSIIITIRSTDFYIENSYHDLYQVLRSAKFFGFTDIPEGVKSVFVFPSVFKRSKRQ